MARITVEDCVDKIPSRFELVIVASQRARELHSGENPTIDKDNDKNTVIALREIADIAIPIDQMKENVIEGFQKVTISDEEDENLEIESSEEKDNEQSEEQISNPDSQENENLEIESSEGKDNEQSEEQISNPDSHIEEEIEKLTLAEDKNLEKNIEINEDLQSSVNTSSSENDDQESDS